MDGWKDGWIYECYIILRYLLKVLRRDISILFQTSKKTLLNPANIERFDFSSSSTPQLVSLLGTVLL